MTERSIVHGSFVIERSYPAAPARVFAAWADPQIKARWFGDPGESGSGPSEFEFRVGGREFSTGKAPNGQRSSRARRTCRSSRDHDHRSFGGHWQGVRRVRVLDAPSVHPNHAHPRLGEDGRERVHEPIGPDPVSYTHLTLPTSDLV